MKGNKIKLFTEILAIVVIVLVSFVGVYKQDYNKMINQVKEYKYSKDLDGYREVVLEVSSEENKSTENETNNETTENKDATETTEEKNVDNEENKENEKTEENSHYEEYRDSKKLIEKRLSLLGVQDYTISQNEENGSIYLQIPENEETDHILSNLLQKGNFEIKDSEDSSKVFVNNDNLKKVSTVYNNSTEGTTVYLQFEFDKNGKNILKEISSGEYKTNQEDSTDETENSNETENENAVDAEAEVKTQDSETEENSETNTDSETNSESDKENKQKKIVLSIDDNDLITSSFDEVLETGAINLSMNKATKDQDSINDTLRSASTISNVLNSGKMPLTYEIKQNSYIQTDITQDKLNKAYIVIGVVFVIALIYMIIKYKTKGITAAIANIGFLALDLLLIRYTNVAISLESIVIGTVVLAINYLFVYEMLKMEENTKIQNLFKSQILKVVPIVLIAIIFAFSKVTKLSTAGMFLFWGITLSFIYNYTLTRDMIK